MGLTISKIVFIVAAYLADAYCFDGLYFKAFRETMDHIWHGY